jgi:hypothetical protein
MKCNEGDGERKGRN